MSEDVIQIDIESELERIISQLNRLPDQIAAPKLLKNALNAAARKVRKQMLADVKDTYAVTRRNVLRDKSQGAPEVLAANASNLSAAIYARGPMQDIMTFLTRPNTASAAAAAQVFSSGSLKPLELDGRKAFAATFASGHTAIVQRESQKRLPVKKLLSPSVPHMLGNEAVQAKAEEMTYTFLQAEIQKRIEKINLG